MKQVAKFQKVSLEQFEIAVGDLFTSNEIKKIYENLKLPERATKGSAGYDFFSPFDFSLKPGEGITIPTGIRVYISDGWVLKCYPRSGLGFKYKIQFNNTVGIIDSDYYNSDNEGHIHAKIFNDNREGKILDIKSKDGFMQGIFVEYGITFDDICENERNGGFGSTSR